MRLTLLAALIVAVIVFASERGVAQSPGGSPATLTGTAAYGDWRSDMPGQRRRLSAADMPPPYASRSVGNAPRIVAAPRDAGLKVPPGFTVRQFASGLENPRVVRVAPNGDVFVESATERGIGFGVGKVRLAWIHRRHPRIGRWNFDLDPLQLAGLLCHDARRISVDGRIDPSRFEVLVQIDDVGVEVEARAHQLPQVLDIEEALNGTHLLPDQVSYGREACLRIDRALIGVNRRRQADHLCTGGGSIPIADRDIRTV